MPPTLLEWKSLEVGLSHLPQIFYGSSRLQGPKCPEDNEMTETGDGLGALMQNAERKSPGSSSDVLVLSGLCLW